VVLVRGAVADKPARLVAEADPVVIDSTVRRFVSRGGEKLDAALERFAVEVLDRRCLDAGASTGGFSDCLLQRGAAHVVAVDVCKGMFDSSLRGDPRVTLLERTNVRHLDLASTGGVPFDVVVCDLSFISITAVMEVLACEMAAAGADLVLLVKPQFEVGKVAASRGRGVVKDPAERRAALERCSIALESAGASIMDAMASPLLGPAGNAEYFLHAKAKAKARTKTRSSADPQTGATTNEAARAKPLLLSTVRPAVLDAAVAASPDSSRGE